VRFPPARLATCGPVAVITRLLFTTWFTGGMAAIMPSATAADTHIGVGAKPLPQAEVAFDGSRAMLDAKWTYWEGPGFKSSLPIKWKIVDDPIDGGTCLMTDDPVAAGGKYGTADVVTKKAYRDFRLHIEFLITKPGGNSGVYLQNAYDIVFRAARFADGKRTEKAIVSMYFNGKKVHDNVAINQVWGGARSGVDGGNDGGKGITDSPQGLKLQCEGHDVRYRNIWIQELDLTRPDTSF
jgi:hypothetical protein